MKTKSSSTKSPDPDSNRSRKRRNRGFTSLLLSSRIHRRAERRIGARQTINHVRYAAGLTIDQPYGAKSFTQHSAGRLNYH